MSPILSILAACLLAALALVGVAIGVFYRRKFGESTQAWLLGMGAAFGLLGQILSELPKMPLLVGDLIALVGAIFLAVGTFWLWFVMMGPKK